MSPKQLKDLKKTAILIDESALRSMFEGKNKGGELLKKLKEMKDGGMELNIRTLLSSFLRAIFLSDPKTKISKLQKTLSFLTVYPSLADFRDGEAVTRELLDFARMGKK